jgi:hypothetical protein
LFSETINSPFLKLEAGRFTTTKGKEKKKTEYQYTVAKHIFEDHAVYNKAFRAAQDPKARQCGQTRLRTRCKSQFS